MSGSLFLTSSGHSAFKTVPLPPSQTTSPGTSSTSNGNSNPGCASRCRALGEPEALLRSPIRWVNQPHHIPPWIHQLHPVASGCTLKGLKGTTHQPVLQSSGDRKLKLSITGKCQSFVKKLHVIASHQLINSATTSIIHTCQH